MPDLKIIFLQLCINILFQSCPKACSKWKAWGGSKDGLEPNWLLSMSPVLPWPHPSSLIIKMTILPWRVLYSYQIYTHPAPQPGLWGSFLINSASTGVSTLTHIPGTVSSANQQVLSKQGHISGHWTTQLAEGKFGRASGLLTKMEIHTQKNAAFKIKH